MPRFRNALHKEPKGKGITRRSFLKLLATGGILAALQMTAISFLSFLYPNALKTPPSVFTLGKAEDLLAAEGKTFLSKYKVFIEVKGGEIRAQTAVCTHLGCTINAVETGYSCPCHGSTYDLDGANTGGPAPTPLVFYKVYTGASDELQVDRSQKIHDAQKSWYRPLV